MPLSLKKYLFAFFTLWIISSQAQLSPDAKISVITCGPGSELYASFGHSAFRVQDPVKGLDLVYNYGTFDFNTPGFYTKFAKGQLLYSLSRNSFENFLYTYQLEDRWVKEQILALSPEEENKVLQFLEYNYLPENRDYLYNFLDENCSTKIPEVLERALPGRLVLDDDYLEQTYTFRQLIQQYLRTNSWSSLGIDLALGSVIDRKASPRKHMFLPDYVLRQMNHAQLNGNSLVKKERSILQKQGEESSAFFLLTPAFWLLLLFLITALFTYKDLRNGSRSRALDSFLLLFTGILGVLIVFLWFFTDHTTTLYNYNILWAFPLNLLAGIAVLKKANPGMWFNGYLAFLLGMLLLTPVLWILNIQVFSPLMIIIWATLGLRYAYLYRYFKAGLSPTL
ncbi:DUF4105 domain-containing protein [Zeaxanthinibacter sp. PT1]|uniref:Lnb N-terminal periplasmic domain-containing protein n=1 Tax=Zeaxanthinibacter TaxID=561554 RepID=UPI00234AC38D|nr:DUF4105 domain-containing protein [Zeaxanthinibacter sp. PT1]MDC6352121.1 DUF4105 domain-containing protein [Zeaxanthinibacter sp. PT1]